MKLIPFKTKCGYKIFLTSAIGKIDCTLNDKVIRLDYILISKQYRNKGLGKQAVRLFMKLHKGKKMVTTSVAKKNKASIALFISLGFKQINGRQLKFVKQL